jgi:hypothetical protein
MKLVNLPVSFEPYSIPSEIPMIIPGGENTATKKVVNVPLSSLPTEALEAIIEQFAQDLFAAAGREP